MESTATFPVDADSDMGTEARSGWSRLGLTTSVGEVGSLQPGTYDADVELKKVYNLSILQNTAEKC